MQEAGCWGVAGIPAPRILHPLSCRIVDFSNNPQLEFKRQSAGSKNMYAIISDGSKQYRVEEGQELVVSYRDVPAGEKIKFDSVLAVGGEGDTKLGSPMVKGASVAAEVIGPEKGEKIVVQKLRRRKNSRRRTGERHVFTRVRVGKISV
jgi:large subunit ribosomal protein L21